MLGSPIDFAEEFNRLTRDGASERRMDDAGMSIRLVRVAPDTVGQWDSHADGPETAILWEGDFTVEFRDGRFPLTPGSLCVVPAEKEHRGLSDHGAHVVLLRRLPAY